MSNVLTDIVNAIANVFSSIFEGANSVIQGSSEFLGTLN